MRYPFLDREAHAFSLVLLDRGERYPLGAPDPNGVFEIAIAVEDTEQAAARD